ncbi:hypothetical protein [Oceanimonas smirnovii]|uniref:restriction endonuclease-related protein n=1 Tax=Oceanimonas smirnovii TaxID=264574 RepID=UPI00037EF792|nr:hypothetical protein [Oceanimonas smirnovii]
MASTHLIFAEQCQQLFAEQLGHGRRWKSACARALQISRATLYRYLNGDSAIPSDIQQRLEQLSGPSPSVINTEQLVRIYASALVQIQDLIDEQGYLNAPYPPLLIRAFSLSAAHNIGTNTIHWPTDLQQLITRAQQPLYEWVSDMSWDEEHTFFSACLLEDSGISIACRSLAVEGHNPEQELKENQGFAALIRLCKAQADGEQLYRTWRRILIEHPLIDTARVLITHPDLVNTNEVAQMINTFYQPVHASMCLQGKLPLCSISGTILCLKNHTGDTLSFSTECREPEAIRLAGSGCHDSKPYHPGMMYLRRPFRTFWALPGRAELALAQGLENMGWQVTLWPGLDRMDLLACSPRGRKIAVDVKDYFSAQKLAARFNGFKEYTGTHECYLVIPDYLLETDSRFEARFNAFRSSYGKQRVTLSTVSGLLASLEDT